MSQPQSHGRPAKRAITHSQSKNDIGALKQEANKLGEKRIASTNEYKHSISKAKRTYMSVKSQIYTQFLAKLQDISMSLMCEDEKKQAENELKKAVENKLDEMKNQASELEAEQSEFPKKRTAEGVRLRTKANAIRQNPEEIENVKRTPEGMQAVEKCNARLADAYKQLEDKVWNSYKPHLEKIGELTENQKKIQRKLDKKNIPEVPEDRAEANGRLGDLRSRDPKVYLAKVRDEDANDSRRILLEMEETIGG